MNDLDLGDSSVRAHHLIYNNVYARAPDACGSTYQDAAAYLAAHPEEFSPSARIVLRVTPSWPCEICGVR